MQLLVSSLIYCYHYGLQFAGTLLVILYLSLFHMDHDIFYYFPQAKKEGQNHSIFHISHADVYSWGWIFPLCWKVWFEGSCSLTLSKRYSPWGGWFHYNPRELLNFHLFGQFATDIRKSPHQQKLLPRCILHGTRPDYDGSIGTACPNPHMFIFNLMIPWFLFSHGTVQPMDAHTCLQVACVCHRLSQESLSMAKLAH